LEKRQKNPSLPLRTEGKERGKLPKGDCRNSRRRSYRQNLDVYGRSEKGGGQRRKRGEGLRDGKSQKRDSERSLLGGKRNGREFQGGGRKRRISEA